MPLVIQAITRRFKFQSITLPDPDPEKTPDQVRESYAELYPDLTNAQIKGPVRDGTFEDYSFQRSIGDKG